VQIPESSLVFILGASGIGKSTLLETLGLMNNTFSPLCKNVIRFKGEESDSYVLNADIWSDRELLCNFRYNHYSFVFQEDFLIPSMTIGENLTLMLRKRLTERQAKESILKLFPKIDLHESLYDRRINEVSGGQKKRISFLKAFAKEFTVLFMDEPTGNLDPYTSDQVMELTKEYLIESGKTGIVVSHDIRLAAKYADTIYVLDHDQSNNTGRLLSTNTFVPIDGSWLNRTGESILDVFQEISRIYRSDGA